MTNIFNIAVGVKKVIDKELDIINSLKSLENKDVLVGVPEEKDERQKDKITNAQLAFIHSNGSPINNIPARPFIEPSIEKNKEAIAPEMGEAITSALQGNKIQSENHLKKAGMIGQNVSKGWFTNPDNNWSPLKESTIKARLAKKSKGTRKKLKVMLKNGEDVFKPLIDSGELRKSITYVIRDKQG